MFQKLLQILKLLKMNKLLRNIEGHLDQKTNQRTKQHQIRKSKGTIPLDRVGIYLMDGSFKTNIGLVKLHPTKGTYRVAYIDKTNFDSNGCPP